MERTKRTSEGIVTASEGKYVCVEGVDANSDHRLFHTPTLPKRQKVTLAMGPLKFAKSRTHTTTVISVNGNGSDHDTH